MTRTSPRTISRISRTALLVVLATGAVGVSSVLSACSADAGSPLITSHKGSKGTGTSGTDTTDTSGSTDGTGTSTGTPDNTGASSTTPGDTTSTNTGTSTGTGTGTTPAPTSTSTTPTPPAAQDFDIALAANTATVNLQDTTTFQVTIAPKGYVGDVALTVTGLPDGATGAFSADKVALTASAGGTSTLTIKSASAAPVAAAAFKIVATAGTLSHESPATLTVAPKLVIEIPQNANTNTKNFTDIPLVKGTGNLTVVWNNGTNDVVTIHRSNNAAGLSHGAAIQPGATETRTVTATGNFAFYVHNGKDQAQPGHLVIK